MNKGLFRQPARLFALHFLLCFGISLNCGFAETIIQPGHSDAPAGNGDIGALNLPGSPVEYYSFSQTPLYFGPFPPPDDLGSSPGAFLVTGNTFYNFTGDPTLRVYQLNLAPAVNAVVTSSEPSVVPEPRANQLLAAGLLAMVLAGIYKGSKSGFAAGSKNR
ncbi:MAG: hypothetical protein ABUS49_00895 [Acidobacteriota bacterium]